MEKIIIAGDLAPQDEIEFFFERGEIEAVLDKEILQYFEESSGLICNLELPLTTKDKKKIKCGINLKASPKVINSIKKLNPLVVGLANNHILDYGEEGLKDTLKTLERENIAYIGVKNLKGKKQKFKLIKKGGKRIGVYSCAEHEFSILSKNRNGAIPYDPIDIVKDLIEMRKEVDYIVVLYHGGKEEYRYPTPNLQKNCRHMIDCGADLVIVQHNHCIACEERYNNGVIVYGQGNFIFNFKDNEFWRTALLIELKIEDKIEISYIPIMTIKNKIKFSNEKDKVLKLFYERSQEILNENFIKNNYINYIQSIKKDYLKILLGDNKLIRGLNKLIKYRLMNFIFSRNGYLTLLNYIECEAHREILIDTLKVEIERRKNEKINKFFL